MPAPTWLPWVAAGLHAVTGWSCCCGPTTLGQSGSKEHAMTNKRAAAKTPPPGMQPKTDQLSAVQDPKAAMRDLCGSQVEQFNTRLLNDVVATSYLFGIES
jgi:hypothetical protein